MIPFLIVRSHRTGTLSEMSFLIEERLFVPTVAVPWKEVVKMLHRTCHPKHVKKALDVDVDMVCVQAGGHS